MKRYIVSFILCVIISQIIAYALSFVGLIYSTHSNPKAGVVFLNIANIMTISRVQRAKNYHYLSSCYLFVHEKEKELLFLQKSAQNFGTCNRYKKNTMNYTTCHTNKMFLGLCYYSNGNFIKAIETFNDEEAYGQMVGPYILMHDYNNALKYARMALEKNKTSFNYINIAIVYRFLGKDKVAKQYYDNALKLAKTEKLSSDKIRHYIDKYNNYERYFIETRAKFNTKYTNYN